MEKTNQRRVWGAPEVSWTGSLRHSPTFGWSTAFSHLCNLAGSSLPHFPGTSAQLALPLRAHPEGKCLESRHEEGSHQSLAW